MLQIKYTLEFKLNFKMQLCWWDLTQCLPCKRVKWLCRSSGNILHLINCDKYSR